MVFKFLIWGVFVIVILRLLPISSNWIYIRLYIIVLSFIYNYIVDLDYYFYLFI